MINCDYDDDREYEPEFDEELDFSTYGIDRLRHMLASRGMTRDIADEVNEVLRTANDVEYTGEFDECKTALISVALIADIAHIMVTTGNDPNWDDCWSVYAHCVGDEGPDWPEVFDWIAEAVADTYEQHGIRCTIQE